MRAQRRMAGFTLLELAMALSIVAILVRLSVPALAEYLVRAKAAKAAADFNTVRAASFAYFESNGRWPEEAGPGVVPQGLSEFLPRGFTFDRHDYQLDWENWTISDVDEGQGVNGVLVGVSVVTENADLGRSVLRILGAGTVEWTTGDHYTFVIQSTLAPAAGAANPPTR